MMQWFRLYSRMVDDDKLKLLAFEDRWHFVALCCLKSEGLLDEAVSDLRDRRIAVRLGVQLRELEEIGRRLREVELVDEALSPLAWDDLQFRSDSSRDRVQKYREARKSKGLQAQWQPSKALRAAVYERDNHTCVYCGSKDGLSLDHKTPEMHGGDHSFDNLQTTCRPCNARKRDLTDEEYRKRPCNAAMSLPKRPKTADTDTDISSNEDSPSGDGPSLRAEHVFEGYQDLASAIGRPVPRDFTPERRQLVRSRMAQYSLEDFQTVFAKCRDSPFLRGDRDGRTPLTFDWLMKKGNFQKVLEGNYDR